MDGCRIVHAITRLIDRDVLSGLLFNLGIPHLRMYEGYPWRETWIGKWLTCQKIRRFRKLSERQRGLRTILRTMQRLATADVEAVKQGVGAIAAKWLVKDLYKDHCSPKTAPITDEYSFWYSRLLTHWTNLDRRISIEFPGREALILPTRLGNCIRSFEYYPDREYGIDAVTLYPRLIAKIDKDYAAVIDDSKTSLDFLINCSTLSLLLAVSVLLNGPGPAVFQLDVWPLLVWGFELLGLVVLAGLAYRGAIIRASSWGETVKSAFDLYRNALLPQLGYARIPKSKLEERNLWDKVSRQILDGDALTGPRMEYEEGPSGSSTLTSDTERAATTILRGIEPTPNDDNTLIIITLTNESETSKVINAALSDTLPDGWYYQPASEKLVDARNPRSGLAREGARYQSIQVDPADLRLFTGAEFGEDASVARYTLKPIAEKSVIKEDDLLSAYLSVEMRGRSILFLPVSASSFSSSVEPNAKMNIVVSWPEPDSGTDLVSDLILLGVEHKPEFVTLAVGVTNDQLHKIRV